MTLPPTELDVMEDEEWQIVHPDWWRTEFSSVSWSYANPNSKNFSASNVFAQPPHYHESLSRFLAPGANPSSFDAYSMDRLDAEATPISRQADELNPDLVGVRMAREVVTLYEIDVGIRSPDVFVFGNHDHGEKGPSDLHTEINEDEIALNKERWDELVHDLIGGLQFTPSPHFEEFTEDGDESPDTLSVGAFSPGSSTGGLHRSTSTLSSVDLTDSERSVTSASMPSTPKAKTSYANIVVKNVSPSSMGSSDHQPFETSPSRPLNASASSFVPSFSISAKPDHIPVPSLRLPPDPSLSTTLNSPSPISTNFTFPSLNDPFNMHVPPLPSVKIQKDEQGFYDISSPPSYVQSQRPSSALLPLFLQDPPQRRKASASKTRAIVDSLRSSCQSSQGGAGLGAMDLGLRTENELGAGIRSKCASQSPSPSPMFHHPDFFKPRLAVSEDGGDRDSCSSSPSAENGGDGWVGLSDVESQMEVKTKAKRTQDLFLALARHRGNSTPSDEKEGSLGFEAEQDDGVVEVLLPSPPPSPTLSSSDGWIEGSSLSFLQPHPHAQTRPQSHSRSRKKSRLSNPPAQSPRPTTPPPSSTYPAIHPASVLPTTTPVTIPQIPNATPTPYFYPSYPMSYTAYMQMQLHVHMQSRSAAPFPGAGAGGGWFLYPNVIAPSGWVSSPALPTATPAGIRLLPQT